MRVRQIRRTHAHPARLPRDRHRHVGRCAVALRDPMCDTHRHAGAFIVTDLFVIVVAGAGAAVPGYVRRRAQSSRRPIDHGRRRRRCAPREALDEFAADALRSRPKPRSRAATLFSRLPPLVADGPWRHHLARRRIRRSLWRSSRHRGHRARIRLSRLRPCSTSRRPRRARQRPGDCCSVGQAAGRLAVPSRASEDEPACSATCSWRSVFRPTWPRC